MSADCRRCGKTHTKCRAHNRGGNPCGRHPIAGGTVCVMHGGKAPQVLAAARAKLFAEIDPVTDELIRIALEGSDERVKLRAIQDLLNRVGLSAPVKVTLTDDAVSAEVERLTAELIAAGVDIEQELADE